MNFMSIYPSYPYLLLVLLPQRVLSPEKMCGRRVFMNFLLYVSTLQPQDGNASVISNVSVPRDYGF